MYKEVLTYMREGKEFHNSFVLPFLKSLLQHKVRIDKLVCTKSLKAERDYKNPDSIGHLQLSSKFTTYGFNFCLQLTFTTYVCNLWFKLMFLTYVCKLYKIN